VLNTPTLRPGLHFDDIGRRDPVRSRGLSGSTDEEAVVSRHQGSPGSETIGSTERTGAEGAVPRLGRKAAKTSTHDEVREVLLRLYRDLFDHDGYGDLRIEMKIKSAGQKEIILHCGRQYRFLVDFQNRRARNAGEMSSGPSPDTLREG
jgi:hypothetical protein